MIIFAICLIIDIGFYIFGAPPLLITSIIKYIIGSSGIVIFSAAIWWILAIVGVGAMIRLQTMVGSIVVAVLLVLAWMLDILSPLGSMTLALEYPNIAWGLIELFYVAILAGIEVMIFKI